MSTDKKSVDWYNQNAKEYTAHVRNPEDAVYHSLYEKPAMYSLLPDLQGKRILSLGCGSGEDSHYLHTQGALSSVGIDISEGLIKIATESYPECAFKVMDMEKLDFSDQSFDFAYSSLAIHYIENWTRVFQEVYRVLKPNSYFLFSCNHPVLTAMVETENNEDRRLRMFGMINYKESKSQEIVGDYLGRHIDLLPGHKLDVTTWHKPISEILAEADTAGLKLDKFVEPRPLPEMEQVSLKNFERLSNLPYFAIFRLSKA